jgi:hypothetical protein
LRGRREPCSRSAYATLSNTLIGNGLGCWKTMLTRRLSSVTSSVSTSWSSSMMRPKRDALGVSSVRRLSERRSVVLPQPDGPISAVMLRGSMERLTPWTARKLP